MPIQTEYIPEVLTSKINKICLSIYLSIYTQTHTYLVTDKNTQK